MDDLKRDLLEVIESYDLGDQDIFDVLSDLLSGVGQRIDAE